MNHDVQFVHIEQGWEGRQNMKVELACVSNTPSQPLAHGHPLMGGNPVVVDSCGSFVFQ